MADPVTIPGGSSVSNEDVAGALDRVADLLEVQGAGLHRVRAWRHGAELTRKSDSPAAVLASRAERGEIPGIGPRLALAVAELHIDRRDALVAHRRIVTRKKPRRTSSTFT